LVIILFSHHCSHNSLWCLAIILLYYYTDILMLQLNNMFRPTQSPSDSVFTLCSCELQHLLDTDYTEFKITKTHFLAFIDVYVWGLIKNIRDRIYCRKMKASTSYSKLSPSKYDPPDCMQQSCRVVSATSWNCFPFRVLFSLRKRKKSQGAKSGE
jgi:hypothetical protein